MKKAFKIIGWTLFSVLMVVILTVGIAIYILFTPSRLTPVVRDLAGNYITCDYEIGEVELTFFSTFPHFGLRADGLLLINPKEGAQNDTLLMARQVLATVDLKELVLNNNLIVTQAVLDDACVNYYTAADGTTNIDVFAFPSDTTQVDTTQAELPFNTLRVDGLRVNARSVTYVNDQDSIYASLANTTLTADVRSWHDIHLVLDASDVCAQMQNEVYADHAHVQLNAPVRMDLDSMSFALDSASLALNEFEIGLNGAITLGDSIDMDMRLTTNTWQIEPLMALLPASLRADLEAFRLRGDIRLDATARGTYSDTQMPIVELHALNANLWNSHFDIAGQISELEADWMLDVQMNMDLKFPDIKWLIFDDPIRFKGEAKGTTKAKIHLSDLTEMRLQNGMVDADWNLKGLYYWADSMLVYFPNSHARIQFPNASPIRPSVDFVRIDLTADKMDFELGAATNALLDAPDIHLELANIFENGQDYFAIIDMDALDAKSDSIIADLKKSNLEVFIAGGKKVSAKLKTDALNAKMGEDLQGKAKAVTLEAAAKYNPKEENLLLQWNPRLTIRLQDGHFHLPTMLPEDLFVPSIDFKYSNREMTIDNSRIELGNSDLNLQGYIRNIGKWFRHEGVMEGDLNIVSNHCDANQLLAWFSADEGSEEEPATSTENGSTTSNEVQSSPTGESEPFLVPTDVDLKLHTNMQEVDIFNQRAKDLKGGIYVRNGTLVLDEVGFVCRAAKLQLTAMYRTPRRNHLYVGFDYHMIDVDIDELMTMIPNLEEMVPMLASFKGAAEFHLAAETYLKSNYEPKMSTLRGAASLTGKDLVVLDGETFSTISKLLMFSKKTENKIDSLNAEITVYKNDIDVYPLCVQMDNYMVALGGRHRTNMTFDYDINVLKPIYLGVHVGGTLDKLDIKLAPCKFAQDFRPHWYQKVDNESRELRERIKQSMEKNVRIK